MIVNRDGAVLTLTAPTLGGSGDVVVRRDGEWLYLTTVDALLAWRARGYPSRDRYPRATRVPWGQILCERPVPAGPEVAEAALTYLPFVP